MKFTLLLALPLLAYSYTPAPSTTRKAFLAGLASTVAAPVVAQAMDQELILDRTEQWETGKPTMGKAARDARYANSRNQLNSNFAPIKRLTLERKSPVERLDLNAPNFKTYKSTYPGLFGKDAPVKAVVAEASPADTPPAEEAK